MKTITNATLEELLRLLQEEEQSAATIEKYTRTLRGFAAWLGEAPLTKEAVTRWKAALVQRGYAPVTVNGMLSALNKLLRLLGRQDCRVRFLKVQRRLFVDAARELSREEYLRLVKTARGTGRERLALILETICATGIRVSELQYLTAETVCAGRAVIRLKGKIRTIMLPRKLCAKLNKYLKQQKIASGQIFLTRSGAPLSRNQIWAEMKALCRKARVEPGKVFPHNLRHLFARSYYRICRDIVRLADVLGHSSVETTRIYLISTGKEHERQLERLGLVS